MDDDFFMLAALALVAVAAGVAWWLSSTGTLYYWRHPIAWVVDDAMAQSIDIPVSEILTKPPPDCDLSWRGQQRYAAELRKRYAVRKLTSAESKALIEEKRRQKREGTVLAG